MSDSRPSSPAIDRRVVLAGAHNVRDLGGMPSTSGRMVRRGRIYRSDYPGFADLDEQAMRRLGLRTVVDLRRGVEVASECVEWERHGVRYHRCPLVAGHVDAWHARYPAYLESRPDAVVAAVRHVMEAAAQPVLFHCAAGKDRTGVVAALLLSLLGVDRNQITADYLASERSVGPVLARLSVTAPYDEMLVGADSETQRPRAEYLNQLFDWLDVRGGAEEWLSAQGLSTAAVDGFRQVMIESPEQDRPADPMEAQA